AMTDRSEWNTRDAMQDLHRLVLELWGEDTEVDLAVLAQEIAVWSVRLADQIGWEDTRAFFAQLGRIGGRDPTGFGEYLTEEDLKEASVIYQGLGQDSHCAYFRSLQGAEKKKKTFDDCRRLIESRTKPVPESTVQVKLERPRRKLGFFQRFR